MTSMDRSDYDRDIAVLKERVDQLRDRLAEANERHTVTDRAVQDLRLMPGKLDLVLQRVIGMETRLGSLEASANEMRREAEERVRYQQTLTQSMKNLEQGRNQGLRQTFIAVAALVVSFFGIIVAGIIAILSKVFG